MVVLLALGLWVLPFYDAAMLIYVGSMESCKINLHFTPLEVQAELGNDAH